jgi:phenylacetate-coenzyme A ligase PaaK-like adenylate-forming protein
VAKPDETRGLEAALNDTSILELDHAANPDPEEFLHAAMQWHFDPETGSRFWLDHAPSLGFDPQTDIRTWDDLRMFPNVVNELRDVPVEHLIPKGYGPRPDVMRIVESGGTTGAPKRVVVMRDWWGTFIGWCAMRRDEQEVPRDRHVLAMQVTGPHMAGEQWRAVNKLRGGITFSIDMDPRWVKKLVATGRADLVEEYTDHLIDQASYHLITQDIGILTLTPPLLARICRRDDLVEKIQEKVQAILWGGAHMDADSRYLYRTEIFPGVKLFGGYGTTMAAGGGGTERPGLGHDDPCAYDPFSPYVTFSVVDPDSMEVVPFGERGQVVVNHVSKSFLLPANLERDTALRVPGRPGQLGDSIADVEPVQVFEGTKVIEGVY